MKIEELSNISTLGSHCDLFGAVITASEIKDLKILVIGSEECTYYSKIFVKKLEAKKNANNLLMLSLNDSDITLGIEDKIKKAIDDIYNCYSPKALLVITTCIVELIGEDVKGLIQSLKHLYNMEILLLPTEHFRCDNYLDGMGKTLALFNKFVIPTPEKKSFNILGVRSKNPIEGNLTKYLIKNGVTLNLIAPSQTESIEDFQNLGRACVNIVVDYIGLKLAKEMKKKYNIPYVNLYLFASTENLLKEYAKLENILDISLKPLLTYYKEESMRLKIKFSELFKNSNKTAFVGTTIGSPVDLGVILSEHHIVPSIVLVKDIFPFEEDSANYLKNNFNTRFIKSGNFNAVRDMYSTMKPTYFFGMEVNSLLVENSILQINSNYNFYGKFGFESIFFILENILKEEGYDYNTL